jgi:hypothetical protein
MYLGIYNKAATVMPKRHQAFFAIIFSSHDNQSQLLHIAHLENSDRAMVSSNLTTATINLMLISEKLVHVWKAQVHAVLHDTQLVGFLDGTNVVLLATLKIKSSKEPAKDVEEVSNTAYDLWQAQEQQVLSYLLTFVSRNVLVQIAALPTAVVV